MKRICRVSLAAIVLVLAPYFRANAATFSCINTNDSGVGSLRQAILDANANSGLDTISFNIPGTAPFTIRPVSGLPQINSPVIIDGYTQSGASSNTLVNDNNAILLIEMDGSNAGNTNGLAIFAGSSTVRGLVINRFNGDGILLTGNGGNVVEGCFVGTDVAGQTNRPNINGIHIISAPNNTIGGTNLWARNLISGNSFDGVWVDGSSGNAIFGNFIGTGASGTNKVQNGDDGITVTGPQNIVGGTNSNARNVISGNVDMGVAIENGLNSLVVGNLIGTDAQGVKALGNYAGVYVFQGSSSVTGGVTIAGNLISGNNYGILMTFGRENIVRGNFIGTDISGSFAVPNGHGMLVNQGEAHMIGGSAPGVGNLISGNTNRGIDLNSSHRNTIQGNFIGTDVTGNSRLSNGQGGIGLSGTGGNLIGGNVVGAGNVISGNGYAGLTANGINLSTSSATVQGNLIGVAADGVTPLANQDHGIGITDDGGSKIGGVDSGIGNVIAYNNAAGISVNLGTSFDSRKSLFLGNSIFDNAGLGIDLGGNGVTQNDACDPDAGANNLQNFPVLTLALASVGFTTIAGSLNSKSNMTYRLEFFSNPSCDPSGYGEGKVFLGFVNATLTNSCLTNINVVLPVSVPVGHFITSSATDTNNNTSEFSACILVTLHPDADGDGLPTDWEQANGLDPLSAVGDNGATGDADGDGMSNLQEYLAGTHPKDANSSLRIIAIAREGNDVRVTWQTVSGKTNMLQVATGGSTDALTNGFVDLPPAVVLIGSGQTTTNQLDMGGATNAPSRYYRLRLVQ